jgi:AraC-like DNA-binding protein
MKAIIESYGVDATALAKDCGLPPQALILDNMIVSAVAFNDYLDAASRACNNRYLSLEISLAQGWDSLGTIWRNIRAATTLLEAFELMSLHIQRYSPSLTSYIKKEKQGVYLCFEIRWLNNKVKLLEQREILAVELCLAATCTEIRKLQGQHWRPTYTQFRHNIPENPKPLQAVFGDKISFNQDCNALFFTNEECETPIPPGWWTEHEVIHPELSQAALEKISIIMLADRIIRKISSEQSCSIEDVAQQLDMPVRTLQNKLKREGTCYQELLDQVRLESAVHYLRDSQLSVAEISERLNFAETAVFSRFFKKHIGLSPNQMRRELRNN